MKKFILIGSVLCLSFSYLLAQPGPIKLIRHLDDFSYLLVNDSLERTSTEKLKYLPLGNKSSSYISFGGELREQFQYFKNANFGDRPPNAPLDNDGHLWHRVMAHADVQLGQHFRLFSQLSSTFAIGKKRLYQKLMRTNSPYTKHL